MSRARPSRRCAPTPFITFQMQQFLHGCNQLVTQAVVYAEPKKADATTVLPQYMFLVYL